MRLVFTQLLKAYKPTKQGFFGSCGNKFYKNTYMDPQDTTKRKNIEHILSNPVVFGESRSECLVCKTVFPSEKNSNNMETHMKGKRHLKNLQRLEALLKGRGHIIYMKPARLPIDELKKYFSQFGIVTECHVSKKHGEQTRIVFETEDSISKAFKNGNLHYVNGVRIKVFLEPRTPPTNPIKNTKSKLLTKNLLFNLQKQKDIFEEIRYLKNLLCFSPNDQKSISNFSEILSAIVTQTFPGSQLLSYGSSTLRSPLKNSDLDFTLLVENNWHPLSILRKIINYPPLRDISENRVVIPSKRYPLIKMWSRDLNMDIDVSLNNYLALRNNELIRSYLKLSDRICCREFSDLETMVFIIKLWRQQNMITGDPNIHINSYGWMLMIIYYLQRIKYFPSLQKPGSSEVRDGVRIDDQIDQCKIGAWDCNFIKNITIFKVPEEKLDLMQTIKNFFRFYSSEFDYSNHVVDIRHGGAQLVTRQSCIEELELHLNSETCDNSKIIKKFQNPFVIQDPFDLSHNIAKNLCRCCLEDVLSPMRKTLNRYESQNSEPENDAKVLRDSFFEILLPCESAVSKDRHSHQIGFKQTRRVTIESLIEQGFCSLFNLLFIKLSSSIKLRVNKTSSEPTPIIHAMLKERLFTKFDLEEFEEMIFEIITPDCSWLHRRAMKRHHEDEGKEAESTQCTEYQITFYYDILNHVLKVRFQPNQDTDIQTFNNLFSLIKKELKSAKSDILEVF
ncbi:Speckle targeted PIP5K1A-regulated poly(A) polymerase [Thelohanellus kitauei]|uniref:Speckle targeted PIP5K1A-regulated poly(A) polymerase n=1 Tax=Thelohanellus kitauei TaxID=669202 RepID=A0A0C2IA36_THEKT|nr:Speckle targeted PIP5K1A-regulated poly(A) polymerase [Thelohanellus kitauei]